MREVKRDFPWFSITEYEKEAAYLRRRLDTPHSRGILVSSTTALTNTLRYCNVLHSVHKLCLSCSRMPYGTAFHLYADCICSAFFRILMPAFVSRS